MRSCDISLLSYAVRSLMMALLQQLYDAGTVGGFYWMFDGAFGAELRSRSELLPV